jgi:hypothetical protein
MAKINKRLVNGVVVDISDDEMVTIDAKETDWESGQSERQLNALRAERNAKLTETDWTQSRDITLSNDADWKTYRQALRDITDSATSLDDVTWPEKP